MNELDRERKIEKGDVIERWWGREWRRAFEGLIFNVSKPTLKRRKRHTKINSFGAKGFLTFNTLLFFCCHITVHSLRLESFEALSLAVLCPRGRRAKWSLPSPSPDSYAICTVQRVELFLFLHIIIYYFIRSL